MYVLDCITIARSAHLPSRQAGKETLTYLSKDKIQPGSIVQVPLRKQVVPALVLYCDDAKNSKSTIRTSNYQLRRIKNTTPTQPLTTSFIRAIQQTSEYFAVHAGQMLYALTPRHILTEDFTKATWPKDTRKKKRDRFILQTPDKDRLTQYKKLIRESFGKKQSVFICVASMQDGERLSEFLQKGIEQYTFLFHGKITKKKLLERWQDALSTTHPVVIIGTPMFLSLPRADITRLIIEKESSEGYRTIGNPKIDLRIFIEYIANTHNLELIFADSLLRLSTIHRHAQKEFKTLTPLSFRSTTPAQTFLFDMTDMSRRKAVKKASLIFDAYPDKLIRLTKEKSEHTFVFAARKGLAPVTVCQDCGHIVTTNDGSSPMVLYEHPDGNYFYSPHTKEKRSADETCSYCGSWRLKPLGLGIDTIEKEINKIAPDVAVFRLDKDSVSTHKQAVSVINTFYDTPGAILLGTEFTINYLNEVDHCIITTIDSILALPDFQIQEKTLRTLLSFRSKAQKNFIVQTRNPEQHIFEYAVGGNAEQFIRQELESRKKFEFPPFTTLIKITLQGQEAVIRAHADEIVQYLNEAQADVYPAHISKVRGSHILNILLRVPNDSWPNHVLVNKLKSFPPQYKVQVYPENIL